MYNHIHKRTPLHCNTSLHFTTLHPTTLHYTYRHFTPARLIIIIIIIIIPIWTLHRTPRFTPFTALTLHFTSLHFSIILTHSHFLQFITFITFLTLFLKALSHGRHSYYKYLCIFASRQTYLHQRQRVSVKHNLWPRVFPLHNTLNLATSSGIAVANFNIKINCL
jgi:hypothetical protein